MRGRAYAGVRGLPELSAAFSGAGRRAARAAGCNAPMEPYPRTRAALPLIGLLLLAAALGVAAALALAGITMLLAA
jgi:hypothetical protein